MITVRPARPNILGRAPMRFDADCASCLLRRVMFQSRLVGNGCEFEAVRTAVDVMSRRMSDGSESVSVATEVHGAAYSAVGSDDPYCDLKVRADEIAAHYVEPLDEAAKGSDDPLRTAVIAAVVGNIMDFGNDKSINDPDEFMDVFDDIMAQGLGCDETGALARILEDVPGVVYIFDNCGESQLDKVLIRQFRRMGKRVVGVVRGAPILNDVTMEDALRISMDVETDRLLSTGKFYMGIDWNDCPEELVEEIRGCGLILAKGMANYEATSDHRLDVPIVHVLRTKCVPVSESMGLPLGINVVRVIMPELGE